MNAYSLPSSSAATAGRAAQVVAQAFVDAGRPEAVLRLARQLAATKVVITPMLCSALVVGLSLKNRYVDTVERADVLKALFNAVYAHDAVVARSVVRLVHQALSDLGANADAAEVRSRRRLAPN